MKFKKGDEVRIVKPNNIDESILHTCSTTNTTMQWNNRMDQFVGNTVILSIFYTETIGPRQGWAINGFFWLEDWLELIELQSVDPIEAYNRAMNVL